MAQGGPTTRLNGFVGAGLETKAEPRRGGCREKMDALGAVAGWGVVPLFGLGVGFHAAVIFGDRITGTLARPGRARREASRDATRCGSGRLCRLRAPVCLGGRLGGLARSPGTMPAA